MKLAETLTPAAAAGLGCEQVRSQLTCNGMNWDQPRWDPSYAVCLPFVMQPCAVHDFEYVLLFPVTAGGPKASEHDCGHRGLVETLSYCNEDPQHERKTSYLELERACPHPMKMAAQSQTVCWRYLSCTTVKTSVINIRTQTMVMVFICHINWGV